MLWAFEPVKYCRAAPLDPGSTRRRSACRPVPSSTLDFVSPRPKTRVTSGSEVNVSITASGAPTARMSRSPQVSTPRRRLPTGVKSASGDDAFKCATTPAAGFSTSPHRRRRARSLLDLGRQVPARVALALLDRLENERLLLVAHALEGADATILAGGLERVERGDAQLVVEPLHRLRAHALQPQQFEQRGRKGRE